MSARVAVLTTQSAHHAYFARRLAEAGRLDLLVAETAGLRPPYETAHPFESERDAWEHDHLLGGHDLRLDDVGPTLSVGSVNDGPALDRLARTAADVTFVFGTCRLEAATIARIPGLLLNLHGGDPERYRGLDTHLWAVWHGDARGLVTGLHVVEPRLDAGPLVAVKPLALSPGMRLAQLRAVNTAACVDLALAAVRALEAGTVAKRAQRELGRYYSFMPAVLKEVCVRRFGELVAR